MTRHSDVIIVSYMPTVTDRFTLRFRTKKQAAEFRRAAKEQYFSLNEYILRALEAKAAEKSASETLIQEVIAKTQRSIERAEQITSVEN